MRLIKQSVITAQQDEDARVRERLREKRDLETAISESLLYLSGHRPRKSVDYREINPKPATRRRRAST